MSAVRGGVGVKGWALLAGFVALAVMVTLALVTGAVGPTMFQQPIIVVSIIVFVIGALLAFADIGRLHREWGALAELERSGKSVRLGTLVVRRLKRVDAAAVGRRVDPGFRDGEKAIAITELASVGSAVQFVAGVLLVLTVVGTFTGMREGLRELADALTGFNVAGGGEVEVQQIGPLKNALGLVGQAVGANLFALIGSVALSIAAFGSLVEKRGFLAALEDASPSLLYVKLPVEAEATELQRAVIELQRSAERIGGVERAIDGLASEFNSFGSKLETMLGEVSRSMSDTVRLHSLQTHDRLNEQVTRIAVALEATTTALQTTSASYQGLVAGLEERDIGLSSATAAFQSQAAELHEIQRGLNTSVKDSRKALDEMASATADKLAEAFSACAHDYAQSVDASFTRLSTVLSEGGDRFADAATRDLGSAFATAADGAAARIALAIGGTTEVMQRSLDTTATTVASRLETAGEKVLGAATADRAAHVQALERLPAEVARALTDRLGAMTQNGADDSRVERQAVARLLERLPDDLARAMTHQTRGNGDDKASTELLRVITSLGTHVGELQRALMPPPKRRWWRVWGAKA